MSGPDQEKRTSGRKRKSTTVNIDGHIVKKENNYVLKGHSYAFGVNLNDGKKGTQKAKALKRIQRAPRKQSEYVKTKLHHNAEVKTKIEKDGIARRQYMANAYSILEPFLEMKVLQKLRKEKLQEMDDFKLHVQPEIVTTTLRDYQMIGLEWMVQMFVRGVNMILGDEMGLGKTLQTISLISYLKEKNIATNGPSLVICPLSVLYSWCSEIDKHAPSLRYLRLHSSQENERVKQIELFNKNVLDYDFVITTYDMAKTKQIESLVRGTYFNICVLDEGHVIKNMTSQISRAVRKIHSQSRLILTGTPLQNNLVELYAILNYLYPEFFTKPDSFEDAFDITNNRIDPEMLLKANKMLGLFMIRRLKIEVEKMMPKKLETKVLCPLSKVQIYWYKGFLMKNVEALVKAENNGGSEKSSLHSQLRFLVMQLRKCCNHPYMFDFAEDDINKTSVRKLVATSGKLAVLDKILRSLFQKGSRTVIFSQFTYMLDILEDYCNQRGWNYCRFDGSTPRALRNHSINQFNADNSAFFIFLMSTRSGGLGINLQTADTCILYDSDWNPQPDLQAMARVHRIGQKKTVHVYRLVSSGTVEDRILERATKKLYLDQMVNRGVSSEHVDSEGSRLTTAELLASLKFGSSAIFQSSNDLPSDKDIDNLTDRSRCEDTSNGVLKGGVLNSAKDFKQDMELTDTRAFQGMDFRKLLAEKEAKVEQHKMSRLMEKGSRIRKNRIVNLEGKGSGYGKECVPVLAMNNYDLEQGEPSIWRETKKKIQYVKEKRRRVIDNQDFCQVCGDGGTLIMCPLCPISLHEKCCGVSAKHLTSCSHHRCTKCSKNTSEAGGLLFACQSCPSCYCADCLPQNNIQFLGPSIDRFNDLGYTPNKSIHYIHCSKQCEKVAILDFGFVAKKFPTKCPPALNVSYAFGKSANILQEDVEN